MVVKSLFTLWKVVVKSLFTLCSGGKIIVLTLQSVNNDFTTTTKFEQWFYLHFTKCEQWYYQHFVKCKQWFYQQLVFYLLFLQLFAIFNNVNTVRRKCEYWEITVRRKCEYGIFLTMSARKFFPNHEAKPSDLEGIFWHKWWGKSCIHISDLTVITLLKITNNS